MVGAKVSLIKPLAVLFIGAMCIMYPQQISEVTMKIVSFITDIIVKVVAGPLLKAIGA